MAHYGQLPRAGTIAAGTRLGRAYKVNDLDYNGILGSHDDIAKLIFATGFSGHAVMHAATTGRSVAELVLHGRYTSLDLSPPGYHWVWAGQPMHASIVC